METAARLVSDLAAFVLVASLKTTVLVVVVLLIHKLCALWLSATTRYALWFPVLLSLVMPLGFDAALPLLPSSESAPMALPRAAGSKQTGTTDGDSTRVMVANAGNVNAVVTDAAALDIGSMSATDTLNAESQEPAPVSGASAQPDTISFVAVWLTLLPWLWLVGVGVVAAALLVSGRRLARLITRATPAPEAVQRLLRDCMAQTSCTTALQVLQSPEVPVPMIAGLRKPVLLLPQAMAQQLTSTQLRHVFLHELMHLQRGDILINWVAALVQALHWFNPAIWLALFCMRQDRELACDAATLRHLAPTDRANYGLTLLHLNDNLPHRPVPATALAMRGSAVHLHRRIHMLVQKPYHHTLQTVLCSLLLLPLAAVALSQPVPAPAAAPIPAAAADSTAVAAERAEQRALERPVAREPQREAERAVERTVQREDERPVQRAEQREVERAAQRAVELQGAREAAREAEIPVQRVVPSSTSAAMVAPAEPAVDPSTMPSTPALPLLAAVATSASAAYDSAIAATTAAAILPLAAEAPNLAGDPAADAAAIQQLAARLAEVKADKLDFIEKWNRIGNECAERKGGFFGALAASCQRIRTATQRGDILNFSYECYVLTSVHAAQLERYRESAALGAVQPVLEALLRSNEQELGDFCSRDLYKEQYPAFATIVADAEASARTLAERRTRVPSTAWQQRVTWGDSVNSTSMVMDPSASPSPYAPPAPETYYVPPYTDMPSGGGTPIADPGVVMPLQ